MQFSTITIALTLALTSFTVATSAPAAAALNARSFDITAPEGLLVTRGKSTKECNGVTPTGAGKDDRDKSCKAEGCGKSFAYGAKGSKVVYRCQKA